MVGRRIAGIIALIAIWTLSAISVAENLFDILRNLPEVYALVIAELLVATPIITIWMFKPELDRHFERVEEEKEQPKLEVALTQITPRKEVKRVEVWLPSGERRYHDARFCFITITNSGKRVAKDVSLFCSSGMLLMPFKGKFDYRAKHKWERPEDFDEEVTKTGIETFVIAAMDGVDQNDSVDIPPGLRGKTFVLFFTMKDFEPLVIPAFTRIYCFPEGTPPRVKLMLTLEYEGGKGYYTTEFEVIMNSWDDFTPKIVETTFDAYP